MDDSDTFNEEDIAEANRASVARSASIARVVGGALVVVGGVGLLAFAWYAVRTQQRADDSGQFGSSSGADGLDLVDRLDLLVNAVSVLLIAAVVVGLGLTMRTIADYVQARTGSSITGFVVGDPIPALEVELELEPIEE